MIRIFCDFVFNSQWNTNNQPMEILEVASSGEDPIIVSDIYMVTDDKETNLIDQKDTFSNVDTDKESVESIEMEIEEDVSEVEVSNISIFKGISLQ